ncbi:D-aspartate oxidase [Biomphalaria glabrata]|nr:D-aspartate oxidase [Biomphalaria glabrata]
MTSVEKMERIAVVGAGAVGLSTALNVQKMLPNAQVTIIADKFGKDTTSNGAGGFFRPYTGDFHVEDRQLIAQWTKDSWKYFSSLAQSPQAEETGQTLVSGVVVNNISRDEHYALLASLVYDFHKIPEDYLKRKKWNYKYGYSFTSVITQTPKFLPWLTKKFCEAGGSLVNKKLNSLTELAGQYDVVANCCGLGARELLGDNSAFPIRGQLVMVKAPWIKQFFLSDDDIYLIPHDDKIIIGGVREKNNFSLTAEKDTRERILSRAEALFPEVKGAQVIGEWVGLRPARERVRFETEVLDCGPKGKLPVVHNYGHSGQGITLSWGSGIGAAQLVHSVVTSSKSKM